MEVVTSFVVLLDQLILLMLALYQILIALGGFLKFPNSPESPQVMMSEPRFLCLTAAHNEEAVIEEHIKNMLSIDYSKNLFDVVVIADNCTDNTAAIARSLGAQAWERVDEIEKGKGYAMRWAIHKMADLDKYDGICIFDADNLVSANFLTVMAQHLKQGHTAIQAYLDTKNPWDSWVSAAYAGAYWYMNRFWQRARVRLGLSGALGGTGFCISKELLLRNPWEAMSLTEDLEYTVRVVVGGERVFWTPLTRVYDEKPYILKATFPQRTRWLQGHWSTAFKYSRSLLKQGLSGVNKNSIRALDCLIYLWQPVIILLTGLNVILSITEFIAGRRWYYHWLSHYMPYPIWDSLVIVSLILPLIAYSFEDVKWRAFWYYPSFLLFNLTWIPITLKGLFSHRNMSWTHTEHTRAITIHEMVANSQGEK